MRIKCALEKTPVSEGVYWFCGYVVNSSLWGGEWIDQPVELFFDEETQKLSFEDFDNWPERFTVEQLEGDWYLVK